VEETWCSPKPEDAFALLARATVPWWFAGGWAIDLFLKGATRSHTDLDVGCFRPDLGAMLRQLPGWDIRVAADGRLTPLGAGASLAPTAHGLWCRPAESPCWVLEILVEDREGSDWVFRRDRRIRRAATEIFARTSSGLRYLRPEIQLLYKSKNSRPHDDADFRATWFSLDAHARSWLVAQLRATSPEHSWLAIANAG
jgi:hypothetical protein